MSLHFDICRCDPEAHECRKREKCARHKDRPDHPRLAVADLSASDPKPCPFFIPHIPE